jgi:2-polyprenyl-6-methoxyphenol hydroxylase-like FAD-dependent oxidoreductase
VFVCRTLFVTVDMNQDAHQNTKQDLNQASNQAADQDPNPAANRSSDQDSIQTVDVTVVGAGPVGLTLAAELALAGASVQILERRTEPDEAMRAQSVNVPTAEALDRRGLLPAAEKVQREVLERLGSFARTAADRAPGADNGPPRDDRRASESRFTGHFAGVVLDPDLVDWSDPDLAAHTAAAGARLVPQPQLEALLAGHVTRLGVPVHRGVEVTALDDTGEGVVVGTSAGTVRTRWLVGCDGGHSAVRRLAGIAFPGTDPELTGYQAVVDIEDPSVLADGWTWTPRGAYRYGPQPGRVATLEFTSPPTDRPRTRLRPPGGTPMAPVTLDEVQNSLRRISGTDVTLTALRATPTRWTDNTRQAATYRSGRVFLAGDAAHVHPPFGGQGLNLGVGDATNLGWKLGAVLAGWAPEGLLDTYDAERRPAGAWVLDWTRAQIGVLRGDAKSAALRQIVADLLSTRDGTTYAVRMISGVTQRVDLPGEHPLVGRFAPDLWLRDGSRLADHGHDGGFLLLDRTTDGTPTRLAAAWAGRVHSVRDVPDPHVAHDMDDPHSPHDMGHPHNTSDAHDPSEADDAHDLSEAKSDRTMPTGLLMRPDGVVAWAADTVDPAALTGLEAALRQWAGTASPALDPGETQLKRRT